MTSTSPDDNDVMSEATPLMTPRSPSINDRQQSIITIGDGLPKMMALSAIIVCFFAFYLVPVLELNPYLYDMIQEEIEKRVSTLEMYLGLTSRLVAMVPVLALGPLTDRFGRKIGFLCPVLGTWLKTIVYTLTIRYKWPVNVLFLGHVFEAAGGSFAAMFTSVFSFISDVTVPGKQRALIITVFEGLQTLTVAAAEVAYAHWFKTSYLHPLILGSCLGFVNIFLVIFLLPETVVSNTRNGGLVDSENTRSKLVCMPFRLLKRCVSIYFTDTEGRLTKRRLCLIIFTLVIAVNCSKDGVQNLLLMKYPLCWPNSKVYVFSGASLAVKWGVIWLLMPVFQKALNMDDRNIAIVGIVSGIGMMSFMALAQNDTMVYEATAIGVLIRVTIPVIRSVMSSLVGKADQGSMYASFGCIETFGASVFSTIGNRIYYVTLDYFAGTIFLIFAGMYFLALVFVIILNVLLNNRNNEREDNPD